MHSRCIDLPAQCPRESVPAKKTRGPPPGTVRQPIRWHRVSVPQTGQQFVVGGYQWPSSTSNSSARASQDHSDGPCNGTCVVHVLPSEPAMQRARATVFTCQVSFFDLRVAAYMAEPSGWPEAVLQVDDRHRRRHWPASHCWCPYTSGLRRREWGAWVAPVPPVERQGRQPASIPNNMLVAPNLVTYAL